VTDELVWGVADFLCRRCQSILLLTSPHLDASETNLTGMSAVLCSSCAHRIPVRDLPQAHQSQIAGRLRLLLDDDDLVHVSKALSAFKGEAPNTEPLSQEQRTYRPEVPPSSSDSDPPESRRLVNPHPQPIGTQQPQDARPPVVKFRDPSAVDWREFLLVARLGPEEAKAVAASMKSNVGEPIRDKRRRASFSTTRVRRPYVVASTGTEIFTDLTRLRNAGRAVQIGFSREEVVALAFGTSSEYELLEVVDSYGNLVGLLKFERLKGTNFGSVEVFRRRLAPVK
jgi:hypothetical protein